MRERIAESQKTDDEVEPPLVQDFGFHHPESYVRDAVRYLLLSDWTCWPEAGGWAEQDRFLIEDVFTFLAIRRRLTWEVKHGVNTDYEPLPEDMKVWRLEDL